MFFIFNLFLRWWSYLFPPFHFQISVNQTRSVLSFTGCLVFVNVLSQWWQVKCHSCFHFFFKWPTPSTIMPVVPWLSFGDIMVITHGQFFSANFYIFQSQDYWLRCMIYKVQLLQPAKSFMTFSFPDSIWLQFIWSISRLAFNSLPL